MFDEDSHFVGSRKILSLKTNFAYSFIRIVGTLPVPMKVSLLKVVVNTLHVSESVKSTSTGSAKQWIIGIFKFQKLIILKIILILIVVFRIPSAQQKLAPT